MDDIPMVVELWKEMMDFHCERDSFFARAAEGHEEFARFARENLGQPDRLLMVAEGDDAIVGFCAAAIMVYPPVFEIKRFGFIQDIVVTEARRGEGVGRELCERVLDWFRRECVTRVELHAATTNEVSLAFWDKMGFAPFIYKMTKMID